MSQRMWTLVTVIAVLGAVLFGVVLHRLYKAVRKVDETFEPVQLRFRYKAEDAALTAGLFRFSLLFVPMLFYAGLCMAVVAHNAATTVWMRHIMYGLTAGACLCGTVETLLVAVGKPKAAPVFGLIKWALGAVWTLGMFAGLVLRGWAL